MAGSARATLKAAGIRAGLVAVLTAGATYASLMLQVDDDCKKGRTDAAKVAYKNCVRAADEQKEDALWAAVLAGLTALGVRAGGEGIYDFRRQRNGGPPKTSDLRRAGRTSRGAGAALGATCQPGTIPDGRCVPSVDDASGDT